MGLDVKWKAGQVKEYYEVIRIAFIHSKQLYGTIEKIGDYESMIRYKKDDVEHEEMIDNEDFSVFEEIMFTHIEGSN